MATFFDTVKPVLKYGWCSLKITFICFRCLLWSFFFFVLFCNSDFFRDTHLDLVWLLLVLILLPLTVLLIFRQFVSDIRVLRKKYAKNLFYRSMNELNFEKEKILIDSNRLYTQVAEKEIFWNTSTGEEYKNLDNYLHSFLDRRDNHAKEMKKTFTKRGMKSLILSARNGTHSIRFWDSANQISLDYETPIPIHFIECFSITTNTSIIRGNSIKKIETRYTGYSYPFLLGLRNNRGKGKTTYRTIQQPDILVKDYSVNIIISSPNHQIRRMIIRNNQNLVDRITCDLRNLGIKQIYQ